MEPEQHQKKTIKQKLTVQYSKVQAKWNSLGAIRWFILAVSLLILVGIVVAIVWTLHQNSEGSITINSGDTNTVAVTSPEPPVTSQLPLDGALVTEEEYNRIMKYLPMAVMIENLQTIRPVSGLSRADLVFEALVEGGITRYMAVFLHYDVDEIMPVRSSRSYYLDWLEPLDATYMHIGGAISDNPRAVALPRIFAEGIKTYMNASGAWWRKSGIAAPHNAFTSTQRMKDVQDTLGWGRATTLSPWKFKDDNIHITEPTPETEGVIVPEIGQTIDLTWNGYGNNGYQVRWTYDKEFNYYPYAVGGVKQTDHATSEPITAKNIVMQYTVQTYANDGYGHILYDTVGEGGAII
ncbi:DUF3048 domain-containing protein, partial [candidate division WWE3 bacterium]|nr:DUF3048 domain-containing protein [candidate division WWE3 bacterium]